MVSYQHGLLHQSVAVLTHILQDFVGCCLASRNIRFGCHSQWINQSLEEELKHITAVQCVIMQGDANIDIVTSYSICFIM